MNRLIFYTISIVLLILTSCKKEIIQTNESIFRTYNFNADVVINARNGGFFVFDYYNNYNLIKIDANGNIDWKLNNVIDSIQPRFPILKEMDNGNILISAERTLFSQYTLISPDGRVLKEINPFITVYYNAHAVEINNNNNIVFVTSQAQYSSAINNYQFKIFITETDQNGNILKIKEFIEPTNYSSISLINIFQINNKYYLFINENSYSLDSEFNIISSKYTNQYLGDFLSYQKIVFDKKSNQFKIGGLFSGSYNGIIKGIMYCSMSLNWEIQDYATLLGSKYNRVNDILSQNDASYLIGFSEEYSNITSSFSPSFIKVKTEMEFIEPNVNITKVKAKVLSAQIQPDGQIAVFGQTAFDSKGESRAFFQKIKLP
jgi:hypothetical protein